MERLIRRLKARSSLADTKGFTIIEVLIVLAIAGLILVIVFLAVPALQRNSRNTQYRSEASRLLAVAQEYINNNGGNVPSSGNSCSGIGGTGSNCDVIPATLDSQKIWQLAAPKNITTFVVRNSTAATAMSPNTFDRAVFQAAAECGAPATGGTSYTINISGVSNRSLALVFAVENADGTVKAQCIDS